MKLFSILTLVLLSTPCFAANLNCEVIAEDGVPVKNGKASIDSAGITLTVIKGNTFDFILTKNVVSPMDPFGMLSSATW